LVSTSWVVGANEGVMWVEEFFLGCVVLIIIVMVVKVVVKVLKSIFKAFFPQVVVVPLLCGKTYLIRGIAIFGIEVITRSRYKWRLEPLLIKIFPREVFEPGVLACFRSSS
jgi:hypothetical protein